LELLCNPLGWTLIEFGSLDLTFELSLSCCAMRFLSDQSLKPYGNVGMFSQLVLRSEAGSCTRPFFIVWDNWESHVDIACSVLLPTFAIFFLKKGNCKNRVPRYVLYISIFFSGSSVCSCSL
jgi:hypothetical protein